ncbi:MAG TPA: VOC family protein [Chloroflexota bacterium]|nr:VOC family protein [Chloroflexota bacterium]
MATTFQVVFDCADPDAQATFWAAALGYIVPPPPEGFADWPSFLASIGLAHRVGQANAIVDPAGVGPRVYFQRVPEGKTVKNRVHLDLNVSDSRSVGPEEGRKRVAAEAERLIALGARKLRDHTEGPESWTVMADPEGNEFCLH